jgi:hypothetical protein
MAEIFQVAIRIDALGTVALQVREQRARIDPGDQRSLRGQQLSTAR